MSEENVEVVRELYEHWARGQYGPPSLFDPEVVLGRYGSALGTLEGEWRGFEAIGSALREYLMAWEEIRNTPERFINLDGDRVLVLDVQTGRGKNSGVTVERETAWIFTLRDGRIVRLEGYWERAEGLKAAGWSE